MKKIYTYTKMMLLAMMATMAFSSCDWVNDDDAYIAYDITGRWVGQLSQIYYNQFDWTVREHEYTTMFEFYQGDRYGGRGREVDYSRYEYQTYNFSWYVEYGNIYIRYTDGTELIIDGYYVRNNRLYGKTHDGSMEVYLTRYDYYDGYLWDDGGYYWSRKSGTRAAIGSEEPTDSIGK